MIRIEVNAHSGTSAVFGF